MVEFTQDKLKELIAQLQQAHDQLGDVHVFDSEGYEVMPRRLEVLTTREEVIEHFGEHAFKEWNMPDKCVIIMSSR